VAKLVAGPKVYICDQCAAEVIRIMEQSADGGPTPSRSRSGLWRSVRDRILRLGRGGVPPSSESRIVANVA
jgi:hypothetical protein